MKVSSRILAFGPAHDPLGEGDDEVAMTRADEENRDDTLAQETVNPETFALALKPINAQR